MVGGEAGIDERELLGLGIVHGKLAAGAFDREQLGRGMVRPFLTKGLSGPRPDSGGEPDSPLFIQHRVVHAGLRIPDAFLSPVGRWRHPERLRGGGLRIADRHFHFGSPMFDRIQDGHEIGTVFGRTVNGAVGVDGGVPLVGGNLVVEVVLGVGPVPLRDHHVAFQALWPRRLGGGQLTRGDPIGPISKEFK